MTSKARTRMCACVCACSRSLRACVRALADFERVLERGLSIYNIMFIFLSSCASVCSREAQASHARRRALSSSPFRHDLPPSLTTSLPRHRLHARKASNSTRRAWLWLGEGGCTHAAQSLGPSWGEGGLHERLQGITRLSF